MDYLKEIIRSLNPEDVREFKNFGNRFKRIDSRKDMQLFDILRKPASFKPAQIIEELYGSTTKKEAYHGLRKRLLKHLNQFVVLKRMENDNTQDSTIMGLLSLARYLYESQLDEVAWHYLKKAEELAQKNEHYDLLNSVYLRQIEYADSPYALPLNEVMDRQKANKKLLDEEERTSIAHHVIKQRIKSEVEIGNADRSTALVQEVLQEYQIGDFLDARPKLLYGLVSIVRNALLNARQPQSLAPFIIEHYERALALDAFSKFNHVYRLHFLYMIAHAMYKTKRFDQVMVYGKELEEEIFRYGNQHRAQFMPRWIALKGAVSMFQGKVQDAVVDYEELLGARYKLSQENAFNAKLNLIIYYYTNEDRKKATRLFHEAFQHTDGWFSKKMGKDWLLKKNLMEIILQYELENYEIALNRIRAVERYFKPMLQERFYQKAQLFLKTFRKIIERPEWIKSPEALQFIEGMRTMVHQGNQVLVFYAWMKAKIERKQFYAVLLQILAEEKK